MPYYDAGEAAIYYETIGRGKPIVLLHGYALNSLMWECQLPALSEKYRVVTVDLRGFGKSSCGGQWSGNIMADDVSGLVHHLDLENYAILGFSMSGPVALRLALKHPDKIAKLVMVSSILPSTGKRQKRSLSRAQEKELETLTLYGVEKLADMTGLRAGPLVDNMFKRNPAIKNL